MSDMLKDIKGPDYIKKLDFPALIELSGEIRERIIETVSCTGGHLASSLGVIELTIALHYVLDSPTDKIIWDVGHQSYAHKLITGREERFSTLRQYRGISGFPKRTESPHDHFGTGHSSTSISAALGMAEARELKGEDFNVVAVIGDGAMTAGLAFEGLNNAGHLGIPLIVVLNDNEMSISRNVGALSNYLNRILTGELYQRFKKDTKAFLEGIPRVGDRMYRLAHKLEETVKSLLLPGHIFEELGFNYIGPIDGHNIENIVETLKRIRRSDRPVLVHVITTKGKGYEFSEKNPSWFHGVGPFELTTGEPKGSGGGESYSDVFGNTLTEIAGKDERVVAIVAAMTEGTGLGDFARTFPDRFFDVGIAEPHAVTFAAGLAANGFIPVVAVYSTFLQRAYDEILHDVCLQNLPVVFAIDRAGIVGDDGPTHHGAFDISYLRHIPNLVVMAPKDKGEFIEMLGFAIFLKRPVAIRYPRGSCTEHFDHTQHPMRLGEGEILMDGNDLALLAFGSMVYPAYKAAQRLRAEGISTMVVNARFAKPLDNDILFRISDSVKNLVTVEENSVAGGFGSSVLETLSSMGINDMNVRVMGIPDIFVEQGPQSVLKRLLGLDEDGIFVTASSLIKHTKSRH
ncbi:1-deoxy-D-xylulose 5-phosphate synthase [hydrothermal vent metagenome]|uniref:1-deoxy-D-xylulose-5-phosphate synthase n=1 Tax=hydrothermal vent metagenome TaxID=652676 RepID=A0A3B1CUK2_9ZZZZ